MRISTKAGLLVTALLTTGAALGSFAQQSHQAQLPPASRDVLLHLEESKESIQLNEWTPKGVGKQTFTSGSAHGAISVRNIAVKTSYSDLIRFYGDKCALGGLDLAKIIRYDDHDGLGSSNPRSAFTTSNYPQALSSTFVCTDADCSVSIILYHPKQDDQTYVTITRVYVPHDLKP